MLTKLKVILNLTVWLFREKHPRGIRATVNRRANGQTWFLVEPAVIWLYKDEANKAEVEIEGQRYVRIGGGPWEGQYIHIGSMNEVLQTLEKDQ